VLAFFGQQFLFAFHGGGVRGLREDKIGAGCLPERKNPVAKAAPSLLFLRPAVIQTKELGFSIMFRKIS
jgi:hypothetical protein